MTAQLADTTASATFAVARARRLLIGLYFVLGTSLATWLSRLPSIRSALGLSTSQLGAVLLVGSVGSLAMVVVAGGLTNRWGSRRVMTVAAYMFSVAIVTVGLAPVSGSIALLAAGVFVSTCSFALGSVPLNLESVVIERRMGRTVVPQFHAAFSIGSVTGSLLGAAASWAGVPVAAHFAGLGVVALVWRLVAIPGAVLPHASVSGITTGGTAVTPVAEQWADVSPIVAGQRDAPRAVGKGSARAAGKVGGMRLALAAWREPRTLLIGVIVLAAALSEGSANNWLAIGVVDGFAQTEAVAAVVFGVFVASMTVVRLFGTALIDRFGRVKVLTASGISSFVGLMLFGLAPSLPLAVVGAVGWGLGAGLAIPIGMASVAGDRMRTAGRVAVLSAFASVASLVAPPLLGIAAEVMGTRHALLLISGGFIVSIALARKVRGGDQVTDASGLLAPTQGQPVFDRIYDLKSSWGACSCSGIAAAHGPVPMGTC